MVRIVSEKPIVFVLFGPPGAGKSTFADEFSKKLNAVHLSADKLRDYLFDKPNFHKKEDSIVYRLMQHLTEELLKSGINVIYDGNASRIGQRRQLQAIARQYNSVALTIWFQIDTESAFARLSKRDRRKAEERIARPYDRSQFDDYMNNIQVPKDEKYVVISGKHTFNTQKSAVVKMMYEMGIISSESASSQVIKPGLVNLVPKLRAGRVDESRRNIVIR